MVTNLDPNRQALDSNQSLPRKKNLDREATYRVYSSHHPDTDQTDLKRLTIVSTMAKHTLTIRLSAAQYRTLEHLEKKLSIDKTNVIRLALTRLAEAEGFISIPGGREITPHVVKGSPLSSRA